MTASNFGTGLFNGHTDLFVSKSCFPVETGRSRILPPVTKFSGKLGGDSPNTYWKMGKNIIVFVSSNYIIQSLVKVIGKSAPTNVRIIYKTVFWQVLSSEMWSSVTGLTFTDILEERTASIFWVKE